MLLFHFPSDKLMFFVFRDNTPVVDLGSHPLKADYFDDDVLSGVLPTLYSDDPAISEAAILADPVRTRKDIESLNRSFFIPETISLVEAIKVVKRPRAGEADFPFKMRNLERLFDTSSAQPRAQGIYLSINS